MTLGSSKAQKGPIVGMELNDVPIARNVLVKKSGKYPDLTGTVLETRFTDMEEPRIAALSSWLRIPYFAEGASVRKLLSAART